MKRDLITNEQLCALAKRGDADAQNLLIENNLRFIKKTAYEVWSAQAELNRFLQISLDDLVQEGSLGLLGCIDSYNPNSGNLFLTYAASAILNEDLGLLNYIIRVCGGSPLKLLSDPNIAQITLILVMSWRTIGYAMVNILAGLKSIPDNVEEAAIVDGVSKFQMLRYIRLPMIKTPLLISTIILTLSNINNLTVPLSLTGGGPGTATRVIMIPIYRLGFENYQFGTSSALSILLMIVTVVLSIVYVKVAKYEV